MTRPCGPRRRLRARRSEPSRQHADNPVTSRKGFLRLGQLFELAPDRDPLRGGAAAEPALRTHPGDDAERAIGGILARLTEAAQMSGEDGFQPVACLARDDQPFAEFWPLGLRERGAEAGNGIE